MFRSLFEDGTSGKHYSDFLQDRPNGSLDAITRDHISTPPVCGAVCNQAIPTFTERQLAKELGRVRMRVPIHGLEYRAVNDVTFDDAEDCLRLQGCIKSSRRTAWCSAVCLTVGRHSAVVVACQTT